MKTPRIAWDNLLMATGATVTASTEAAGYPAVAAYDWRTCTWWKPTATGASTLTLVLASAQTVSAFGLYGHDLGTFANTIKLDYSTDGGANWITAVATFTPTGTECVYKTFGATSAQRWRVTVTCATTVSKIGSLFIGTDLVMPQGLRSGWVPPQFARKPETTTSRSVNGQFLGRSVIPMAGSVDLAIANVSEDWVYLYWLGFQKHAERRPFFLLWWEDGRPLDAAWCWTESESAVTAQYSEPGFLSLSVKAVAGVE